MKVKVTLCGFVILHVVSIYSYYTEVANHHQYTKDLSSSQKAYKSIYISDYININNSSLLGYDLRAKLSQQSNEANIGVVYREKNQNNIIGLYGFYDAMYEYEHIFNQVTFGSDILYRDVVGARLNVYVPIGNSTHVTGYSRLSHSINGTDLKQQYVTARGGYELEAESKLWSGSTNITLVAGLHHYPSKNGLESKVGPRFRVDVARPGNMDSRFYPSKLHFIHESNHVSGRKTSFGLSWQAKKHAAKNVELQSRAAYRDIDIITQPYLLTTSVYKGPPISNPYLSNIEMPMDFGEHWFNPANQRKLKEFILSRSPENIVEIGSWKGRSTAYMAELVKDFGKIYAVDTWGGSAEHVSNPKLKVLYRQFLTNIAKSGLEHVVIPIRERSDSASRYFQPGSIDIIYVDGDHAMPAVLSDLRNYYPLVKKGGVLCGDDFGWNMKTSDKQTSNFPIKRALNQFLKDNPSLSVNVESNWFWWIDVN